MESMHNRSIGTVICTFALLSVALAQPYNDTQPYSKNPKLESVLSQLIVADNPQEFAQAHNLYVQEGKVRAVVEIRDEKALLPAYAVEEARNKNRVQVLVPIEKIAALSWETNVTFIRAPLRPLAGVQNIPIEAPTALQTPMPETGFSAAILFMLSIALVFIIRKKRSYRNVKKR